MEPNTNTTRGTSEPPPSPNRPSRAFRYSPRLPCLLPRRTQQVRHGPGAHEVPPAASPHVHEVAARRRGSGPPSSSSQVACRRHVRELDAHAAAATVRQYLDYLAAGKASAATAMADPGSQAHSSRTMPFGRRSTSSRTSSPTRTKMQRRTVTFTMQLDGERFTYNSTVFLPQSRRSVWKTEASKTRRSVFRRMGDKVFEAFHRRGNDVGERWRNEPPARSCVLPGHLHTHSSSTSITRRSGDRVKPEHWSASASSSGWCLQPAVGRGSRSAAAARRTRAPPSPETLTWPARMLFAPQTRQSCKPRIAYHHDEKVG